MKSTTLQKQKERLDTLFSLINKHPELRIVPMVATEIIADDGFSSWMAGWGKAEIEHIYVADERIYFKSEDEDEIGENIFFHLEENNPSWSKEYVLEQTELKEKEIPWEEVIVVHITLP